MTLGEINLIPSQIGGLGHSQAVARHGLRSCLRRCAGKSSSDGNVPTVWEAARLTSACIQICSSTPFGAASSAGESDLRQPPTIAGAAKRIHGLPRVIARGPTRLMVISKLGPV